MTKDYSKSKIYKIINDIDDYIYIGSTTEKLCSRMAKHRFDMKKPQNNGKIYQHMRKYGPKYFHIVLIRNYPCTSKEELIKEERREFDLYNKNVLLNIYRPYINSIEKQELNAKCKKIWHTNNKNYHNEQTKQWRQNNKLHVKIYKQKYYHFNKLMQELPFYKVKCFMSF